MAKIPDDYIERCYSGWLGKLIGVRFGIPIEGWDFTRIRKVYGKLDNYIGNYKKMLAADDDTNVPLALLSALYDYTHTSEITPAQIGLALLNNAPYEHGFFWWGGYGISTEHTAYINLREGIEAPLSGSVEHNGEIVAQQIGGQIFIDPWGLIAPGNPVLAAEYAAKAASVTHGGNGVYGGMFVAAAIAAAFTQRDIRSVIETALGVIPADCEYVRMAKDIMRFYECDSSINWEAAYTHIKANWGYDRYQGACHIIPNSAVMIMSMLYGSGDFSKTLCICNMSGWDTDCNTGNVGTIMGVLAGIDGIEAKWRNPINDIFARATVIGMRNLLDVPWCAAYIAALGYKIAAEEIPQRWKTFLNTIDLHFHFEFPGSTHGFFARDSACSGGDLQAFVTQSNESSATGEGALKIAVSPVNGGQSFCVARRTHMRPEDFHDNRSDPSFSPLVYPGQNMSVKIRLMEDHPPCMAALYAIDANSGKMIKADDVDISSGWTEMNFQIPAGNGICIDEIGVCVYVKEGANASAVVFIDDLTVTGNADYGIDFSKERNEKWNFLHYEVSQFTYLRGIWKIENNMLTGAGPSFAEAYTGSIDWGDIDFTVSVTPLVLGRAGIGFRVQGAMRSYCAALEDKKLRLMKNVNGKYNVLGEIPFNYSIGNPVTLRVICKGANINIFESDKNIISFTDTDNPYLTGCTGAILANGGRASFSDWRIKTG